MNVLRRAGALAQYAAAIACLLGPALAFAADAPGCKDAAGLKRFEGSAIVLCEARNFAEYTLAKGKAASYDFDAKKAAFDASEDLEGRLVQNVYAVPRGPSSAEVFRNYLAELQAKGFTVLFQGKKDELGPAMGSFFENMGPGTQIFGYSPDEARYVAAVKEDGAAKTYAAIYVVEFINGYEPRFAPEKGQVMVRFDTLQVGELKNQMVVVSASEIDKAIIGTGRVALYGILFDFNQSTIKAESRPALDEIAKYLKANPERKVYVVGHTDSVGGFDSNMQLSKARAAAVAADLAKTYGIQAARLQASGVGLQSPVASNDTEDGRAKNRRVELVPR
jgi:outer membrane protein OmpA-like peptidoglycan-associated protein